MQLNHKFALVTGGGSGIGLGIALALAREGCHVVIAGRDSAKLEAARAQFAGPPPILGRACDVADRDDVGRLFAWLDQQSALPDILVNSAGVNVAKRQMGELDPADWDRMIAVNLNGTFNCIHAALPAMRQRGAGLIVNISSVSGKRVYQLGGVGYCASKFGVTALGTAVGLDERAHGIHVTNIYPGEVNTPILAQRPTPVPAERLPQMLQPEDIAAMVVAVAKLPPRAVVPEMVITPLYQEYS